MAEPEKSWYTDPYHLFIVIGLLTIVLLTIGSAIYTESLGDYDSRLPIFVGGGAVTAFLVVLLIFWWHQILAGGQAELHELRELASDQAPPLSALKSWQTLYQHMVYFGGSPEILERERARGQRKVVEWFGWANLLALFPLVNVWLYLLGRLSQERFMSYVPQVLIALILLMLLRTYMLLGNRGDYETQVAASLGLEASASGETKRYSGIRNGRGVQIESQGRHSTTQLAAPVPDFEVESVDGKFAAITKLPAMFTSPMDLPKAKRWRSLRVQGGPEGIRIERESRGQNMWLYDLWLAERIAANYK